MTKVSPEVWERLGTGTHGESLLARRASPDDTDRLLAALDSDGRRHLLVLLTDEEEGIRDRGTRGITAATRDLQIPGAEPGRYMDLTCVDPSGHNAFDLVGGELAARLRDGGVPPGSLVVQILSKWRRFWAQPSREILSREAQVGLVAELRFLLHWLLPATSPAEAAKRWKGPHGARHDFEWAGRHVEAKGSTSVGSAVFRIHGLDQLDPPEGGDLFLYGLRLREEGGAPLNLSSLIADVLSAFEFDDAALAAVERSLARAGYSPLHDAEYVETTWRIVGEALYPVVPGFPRLAASSLVEGLPVGVREVAYSVDLDGYGGARLARPDEAADMLS